MSPFNWLEQTLHLYYIAGDLWDANYSMTLAVFSPNRYCTCRSYTYFLCFQFCAAVLQAGVKYWHHQVQPFFLNVHCMYFSTQGRARIHVRKGELDLQLELNK